jgi:hypothetical protein
MEFGSFIELDLRNTGEYYRYDTDIARLNAARTSIYHATRLLNCSTIYLPYYLCSVVRDFLKRKGVIVRYYSISDKFEPLLQDNEADTAILLVNYFGILSNSYIANLCKNLRNVLIDNCPAFFNQPIQGCYNIYSPRKFFGVPDGSYLIGKNSDKLMNEYEQDHSSETASFLLKRIEFGSSAAYKERMNNEDRINKSDIMKMSPLTRALLANLDYNYIKIRRQTNFKYAHEIFHSLNLIDPMFAADNDIVPMVYPLVIEDSLLVEKLKMRKIYTGRWWKHVLSDVMENSFEARLSKYMVPIPIDQRYNNTDLDFIKMELLSSLS